MSSAALNQMDDETRVFCEKYNLIPARDLWSTERKDKRGRVNVIWQIKNKVLQRIAMQEGIFFEKISVLEGDALNGLCVIQATAARAPTEGNRLEVTTFGEATPTTVKIPYPYAMAEKRAKGRAILQILSIYGHIYSEDEFPDEDQGDSEKESAKEAQERSIEQTSKLLASIKMAGKAIDEIIKVIEDAYILNELNRIFMEMRKEEGISVAESNLLKKVLDKIGGRLKEVDGSIEI